MSSDAPLKDKLHEHRIECPMGSAKFIVPECAQKSLINESVVESAIRSEHPDINDTELADYVQNICQDARRLFTTLAYMRKEGEICRFVRDGVTDDDLPLQRKFDNGNDYTQWRLEGKNGKRIEALESWKTRHREKFSNTQCLMTSPVFEPGKHYELDNSIILPFIAFTHEEGKELEFRGGGYSEVLIKCIHPSHHTFWERSTSTENRLVAVKKLISPNENEFRKEEKILTRLGPMNHPNLIRLLATFRQENKWHLIFPYADANLLKYWEHKEPIPNFDETTVLWSLKQMYGIADGLRLIHNFNVNGTAPVEGTDQVWGQGEAVRLTVQPGEEKYGRHGDMKPENILWFKDDPESHDPNGVLKIADFGLGRFHGRDSRSQVNPRSVCWSPTYEPPELKLGTPVSRAYDFWSLGGLYLEYISWLLGGWAAVIGFSNRRALESAGAPHFSDDNYFSITSGEEQVAHVRDGVKAWVKELHQHEKCSALLHDFLELIMEKMLVIDSKKRIKAADLQKRMKDFVRKAEEDKKYLLEPKPWPKDATSDRYNSPIPSHEKPKRTNPKRLNVTFNPETTTHPSNRPLTPSPTRSPTWPIT
ncbi:kinase-like protein [Cenococcum geophilum 1.58]|uniref:kinase-like protein n=1 Tax=Cenococcum geophilum 1.58 TaxID=794803 RepID=UPI00358EFC6E|nr:kinase-like protein [Cenococcum geophilum 1.58]